MPLGWGVTEWVRDWLFTGFPWLVTGYSQVPDSPLAGYAPLVGVYGVSFLLALIAALLAWACDMRGPLAHRVWAVVAIVRTGGRRPGLAWHRLDDPGWPADFGLPVAGQYPAIDEMAAGNRRIPRWKPMRAWPPLRLRD